MSRRLRLVLVASGVALALLTVALLTGGDDEPRRAPLLPTTTRADLSGVVLPALEGTTTTTVVPPAGDVVFTGSVQTEAGEAVPGATISAEWHRVEPPQVVEVVTDETGHWEIRGVAGGRWSIRAWRTPDYATGRVEHIFVSHDEARELVLQVQEVPPLSVTWDIEPDPPIIGRNMTLVAVFAEQEVDFEGRAVRSALTDIEVALVAGSGWTRIRGDEIENTDGDGRVEWVLRCTRGGVHPIRLESDVVTETVEPPGCIPLSATSTTSTEPPPDPPPEPPPPSPPAE